MTIQPTRIGSDTQAMPAVSAVPGVSRKPLDMALEDLRGRFPHESNEVLAEVRAFLSAAIHDAADAAGWLAYGEAIQREVSELVSLRVAANHQDVLRTAPRHLARLHELLQALVESLSAGGLLRPANPRRRWEAVRPEIEQLGKALDLCLPGIAAAHTDTVERMAGVRRFKQQIRAVGLAAEVLVERLSEQNATVLAGRQASLLSSAALLEEVIVQLELDDLRWAALIEQIRDGGLVRLPCLVNSLAGLPAKPNDTERFLLTEKLAEFLRFFERKQ